MPTKATPETEMEKAARHATGVDLGLEDTLRAAAAFRISMETAAYMHVPLDLVLREHISAVAGATYADLAAQKREGADRNGWGAALEARLRERLLPKLTCNELGGLRTIDLMEGVA